MKARAIFPKFSDLRKMTIKKTVIGILLFFFPPYIPTLVCLKLMLFLSITQRVRVSFFSFGDVVGGGRGNFAFFFNQYRVSEDLFCCVNLIFLCFKKKKKALAGDAEFLQLVRLLLMLDPDSRITASDALRHPFFRSLNKS